MNLIPLCITADWITAYSTAGLLLFTVILARIAYVTYKGSEGFNRLQVAENKIFKMVELHYINLNNIKVKDRTGGGFDPGPKLVYGSEAFESMYVNLNELYNNIFFVLDEEEKIKEAFESLYKEYGGQFGNYYKNLYLLIDYIDKKAKEDITGFDSSYYIRLIKAQLSKYEILMLAYNCIWIYGETQKEEDNEFLKYAMNYKLLSALEKEELMNPVHQLLIENYY